MPLWTKHNTRAEFHVKHWCLPPAPTGPAGTVWPCHAAPLRECFKCINWVMFTAACLGHFWWTHWHGDITRYIIVSEDMCTIATADRKLLFFWDQGPEEAACWRPHQGLKRDEKSLSSHYATILSFRFRLLFALFMLVHGETLWAFKSWGSYINLETKKTSLPLSLSFCLTLCFTLLNTHSGLETN